MAESESEDCRVLEDNRMRGYRSGTDEATYQARQTNLILARHMAVYEAAIRPYYALLLSKIREQYPVNKTIVLFDRRHSRMVSKHHVWRQSDREHSPGDS